jgi:hypothetical protein
MPATANKCLVSTELAPSRRDVQMSLQYDRDSNFDGHLVEPGVARRHYTGHRAQFRRVRQFFKILRDRFGRKNRQKKEKRRVPALPPLSKRTTPLLLPQLANFVSPHLDTRKALSANPYPRYLRHPHAADKRPIFTPGPSGYGWKSHGRNSWFAGNENKRSGVDQRNWRTPRDLNPQPSRSKRDALSN